MARSPRQPIHQSSEFRPTPRAADGFGIGRISKQLGVAAAVNAEDGEAPPRPRTIWLDRGASLVSDATAMPSFAAVSRRASLQLPDGESSFWLVLRGSAQIESKEGRFWLHSGSWIALDGDSRPLVLTDAGTLLLMLSLPAKSLGRREASGAPPFYPGRGTLTGRDRRIAFGLWREARSPSFTRGGEYNDPTVRTLHFLSTLQSGLIPYLDRCPGTARSRSRHLFSRMQRALLWIEGNVHRTVSLPELSGLCSLSTWYFTKTFKAVYGQGPREMTTYLRLRLATDLLRRSDLSIGDIGSRCGYQNACSFARAFRGQYGMSATQYRNQTDANPGTRLEPSTNAFSGVNAQALRNPSP